MLGMEKIQGSGKGKHVGLHSTVSSIGGKVGKRHLWSLRPRGGRRFHPSGNDPPVPLYGDRPAPLERAIPWAYPSARRSVFLLVQPTSDRTPLHHPRVAPRRFELAGLLPFGGQWPDSIRVRRKPAGLVIPSPASPRT